MTKNEQKLTRINKNDKKCALFDQKIMVVFGSQRLFCRSPLVWSGSGGTSLGRGARRVRGEFLDRITGFFGHEGTKTKGKILNPKL